MITEELKDRIVKEMLKRRKNFSGSDAKYATSLGINSAQYSRVKNGERDKVLSDATWVLLARKLEVSLQKERDWVAVRTPVYDYITAQLEMCQMQSISAIMCDLADIGKTYTATQYVKNHKNAVLIDCSQVKTKRSLIKQIAKEFGVQTVGKYSELYEDLIFYLKTIENPLIILDEAGDLQYDAFLEIKALWNASENVCGFYMMGADGLEAKMKRAIENKKVGYTEIFSRFGKRFGKVIADGDDGKLIINASAMKIIKANAPEGADVRKILNGTMDGEGRACLRRISVELNKLRV